MVNICSVLFRCFVLMQCGPRVAPTLHCVNSLGDGLSITESGALLALCGRLLLVYWLLYMSITSRPTPLQWWCHISLRHFCWGAVVSRKGGLDPVQVHLTVPRIFISLSCLADGTLACLPHSHNVVREPGLGHSGGLRGRKTGVFLTALLVLLANTEHAS